MVAIIVPVYNVERYIRSCVESVLQQTYNDIRLVLVDDGSTDASGLICDEYAARFSSISVIHKTNGGLSSARNAGIDFVCNQGGIDWISFLDSDDTLDKKFVGNLLEAVINQKTQIAVSMLRYIPEGFCTIESDEYEVSRMSTANLWKSYGIESIVACGKLFYTKLFEGIRFPEGKIHEDEFTTYKLLFKTDTVCFTKSRWYNYLQRMGSISHTPSLRSQNDLIEAKLAQIAFFEDLGDASLVRDVKIKLLRSYATYIRLGNKSLRDRFDKLYIDLRRDDVSMSLVNEPIIYAAKHPILCSRILLGIALRANRLIAMRRKS